MQNGSTIQANNESIVGCTNVGRTTDVNLYKNGVALGTQKTFSSTSFVQYNQTISNNISNITELSLKLTPGANSSIFVRYSRIMYDPVPAPIITSPSNNSGQTSNINITTNSTGIQYQVSTQPDFSTFLSNTTKPTLYSGNLTLPTGLNYIRVRGYQINGTTLTSSTLNQIVIYSSKNHNISYFLYNSSYDSTINLGALVRFDMNKTNMPILVMVHGITANAGYIDSESMDWAFNSSYHDYFVIAPELRGQGNSMDGEGIGGTSDIGGMEVADIYDAVEYVKSHYSIYVNPDVVFINGLSNGGADTYLAIARYPNYFKAASPYFGITNYSQWWNETVTWKTTLNNSFGCTPLTCIEKYDAHSILSPRHNAINNINIPLFAVVGVTDSYVPPHHTMDIKNATNYPNQSNNQWSNISHITNQQPTRTKTDAFFYSHINSIPTNYININMTILGHINYSGLDIRIYNSSGSFTDKISYVTLTTDILSGYQYDLIYKNNYSIIDTQTAINNNIKFNITETGIFIVEPHVIGNFNSTTILPSVRFINGTVIDSSNKTAIPNVAIFTNTNNSTTTNGTGFYSFAVASGTYNLTAMLEPKYYTNNSITVSTELSVVVWQDVELLKKPTSNITGSIRCCTGVAH